MGMLVLDDPAGSAVPCEKADVDRESAGSCGGPCVTDKSCSGLCSHCAEGECVEPVCSSDADCGFNGNCVGGACVNCDVPGAVGGFGFTGVDCSVAVGLTALETISISTPHGERDAPLFTPVPHHRGYRWAEGHIGTVHFENCSGGERDYLAWQKPDDNPRHPSQSLGTDFRQLLQHSSRNPFVHFTPISQDPWHMPRPAMLFFDYAYPAIDSDCRWNENSTCVGTCSSGAPCMPNSINTCGCTDCAAPETQAKCDSRIAAIPWANENKYTDKDVVWDGEPGVLFDTTTPQPFFCERTGTQSVRGTKGCPSYPTMAFDPANASRILLFYNVGDGKTVGLASGPERGPWEVVVEPVLSGYQNLFPYLTVDNVMHFVADKIMPDGTTTIRHLATPDGGVSWVEGKEELVPLHNHVGTNFTTLARPRLYWIPDASVPSSQEKGCAWLYTEGTTHNTTLKQYRTKICPQVWTPAPTRW